MMMELNELNYLEKNILNAIRDSLIPFAKKADSGDGEPYKRVKELEKLFHELYFPEYESESDENND